MPFSFPRFKVLKLLGNEQIKKMTEMEGLKKKFLSKKGFL